VSDIKLVSGEPLPKTAPYYVPFSGDIERMLGASNIVPDPIMTGRNSVIYQACAELSNGGLPIMRGLMAEIQRLRLVGIQIGDDGLATAEKLRQRVEELEIELRGVKDSLESFSGVKQS